MPEAAPRVVAYLGVGANLEPERHIAEALELLAQDTDVLAVSRFYRTPALDRPEQPDFLNGVCRIATHLEPRVLKFDVLRGIERRLGRVRTEDRYAARTVDLDILLYDDIVCDENDLRIPDPDIRVRPFVAVPLLELAPDAVLPDTGERLADVPAARRGDELRVDQGFSEKLRARFQNERQAR